MADRFKLEEQITNLWNVKEELELIAEGVQEEQLTQDELVNALLGIAQLYELRCQRLMDTFEAMLRAGEIKN